MRRIPRVIWIRIRDVLREYLLERGAQGIAVWDWFHRQFRECARVMFLSGQEGIDRCRLVAEYFTGVHYKGKSYWTWNNFKKKDRKIEIDTKIDRRINPQSLVMHGRYNLRRLVELPSLLITSKAWTLMSKTLCGFDFIVAKVKSVGFDLLLGDYVQVCSISTLLTCFLFAY